MGHDGQAATGKERNVDDSLCITFSRYGVRARRFISASCCHSIVTGLDRSRAAALAELNNWTGLVLQFTNVQMRRDEMRWDEMILVLRTILYDV